MLPSSTKTSFAEESFESEYRGKWISWAVRKQKDPFSPFHSIPVLHAYFGVAIVPSLTETIAKKTESSPDRFLPQIRIKIFTCFKFPPAWI